MSATIIDGKAAASLANSVYCSKARGGYELFSDKFTEPEYRPTLAIMSIGDDPASEVYVRNKMRACKENGIGCVVCNIPKHNVEYAAETMQRWANDPDINGIILQLPAPFADDLVELIPAEKDVDGFKPDSPFTPCTPAGIISLIQDCKYDIAGANAVVVGRSDIVGRPVADLLLHKNCTVTVCHSKTVDLASHTKRADILVVAAGVPNLITGDMIKPGAIVIDVGINRVNGKLVGDVDFESAKEVAGWITPVPGGVGPMTVAMLLKNVCEAYKRQHTKNTTK